MSDSSRPHGLQPTRLLPPWDFPGKSAGVGCHCVQLLSLEIYQKRWQTIQYLMISCHLLFAIRLASLAMLKSQLSGK